MPDDFHSLVFCEKIEVGVEIGQEDVLAKVFKVHSGVPGQPIANDCLLVVHALKVSGGCRMQISWLAF